MGRQQDKNKGGKPYGEKGGRSEKKQEEKGKRETKEKKERNKTNYFIKKKRNKGGEGFSQPKCCRAKEMRQQELIAFRAKNSFKNIQNSVRKRKKGIEEEMRKMLGEKKDSKKKRKKGIKGRKEQTITKSSQNRRKRK